MKDSRQVNNEIILCLLRVNPTNIDAANSFIVFRYREYVSEEGEELLFLLCLVNLL